MVLLFSSLCLLRGLVDIFLLVGRLWLPGEVSDDGGATGLLRFAAVLALALALGRALRETTEGDVGGEAASFLRGVLLHAGRVEGPWLLILEAVASAIEALLPMMVVGVAAIAPTANPQHVALHAWHPP